MGAHGASLLPQEGTVLTHCNAGALATAGYGTALGVIRGAIEAGRPWKSIMISTPGPTAARSASIIRATLSTAGKGA